MKTSKNVFPRHDLTFNLYGERAIEYTSAAVPETKSIAVENLIEMLLLNFTMVDFVGGDYLILQLDQVCAQLYRTYRMD